MKYRVYAYAYDYGWEKFYCDEKRLDKIISSLDPEDYGQYIIIKELHDRDEIADSGIIARPKTYTKKFDKKKKKK